MTRAFRGGGVMGNVVRLAAAVAVLIAAVLVLSAVRLLPQIRSPFAETTVVSSQPVVLKSITSLSRYEAASGSFQVIVDLSKRSSWLPSFIEGTQTLFIGAGTDVAFVDFSQLSGNAIEESANHSAVTIKLPAAQLAPAALNVRQSYVFGEQQGLLNRLATFFSGDPNSQQQVYIVAQQKIQNAARQSPLIAQAEKNTQSMLTHLLGSLGFQQVTVTFGASQVAR